MRNESQMINPTLAPDLLRKQYELAQNQRYAQMLMEDGSQMPQGQMVSGHYVAPSITQYLAQALKSGLGGSIARDVPNQMADMSRSQTQSIYNQFGLGSGSPSPQALAGALGSGGQAGGSIMPSIPGMSREQQAMIAAQIGLPEYLKLAANKGGPINVAPGGTVYNQQTGNVDFVAPQNGIAMQGGQAFAVPGYSEAQAGIAGAQTSAQEQARAALDLVKVENPDGSITFKTRQQIAEDAQRAGGAPGKPSEKVQQANEAMGLISQARQALPMASSGLVQGTITGAQEMIGVSSEASKADAQLKVIAGRLVGMMPRFEGPQSNIDVEIYRQMAGDVANSSLPIETRMSALDQLEVLQQKYATQTPQEQRPQQTQQAPAQQQPATPSSRAEYDALPSGAMFRAPDGTIRRKP